MPGSSPGMTSFVYNAPHPKKLRLRRTKPPQPHSYSARLLAVADAIDRAGPVVGDEDRTVLVQDDVVGTAEIALIALDPAGGEDFLLGILAVGSDSDAHDAAALGLVTVPGAMLRDQ